jgi:hypothetical protein
LNDDQLSALAYNGEHIKTGFDSLADLINSGSELLGPVDAARLCIEYADAFDMLDNSPDWRNVLASRVGISKLQQCDRADDVYNLAQVAASIGEEVSFAPNTGGIWAHGRLIAAQLHLDKNPESYHDGISGYFTIDDQTGLSARQIEISSQYFSSEYFKNIGMNLDQLKQHFAKTAGFDDGIVYNHLGTTFDLFGDDAPKLADKDKNAVVYAMHVQYALDSVLSFMENIPLFDQNGYLIGNGENWSAVDAMSRILNILNAKNMVLGLVPRENRDDLNRKFGQIEQAAQRIKLLPTE